MAESGDPRFGDAGRARRESPRAKPADPLGKRALFWAPTETGGERGTGSSPLGKHALFSDARANVEDVEGVLTNPIARRGPLVVTCSSCRAVSRIGLLDLIIFQFPIGFWLPRGRFDRRMTCPACRRRVWASVTLRHA